MKLNNYEFAKKLTPYTRGHFNAKELARFFVIMSTVMAKELKKGNELHLSFGNFELKEIPASKVKNFHTQEMIDVPEHTRITYKIPAGMQKVYKSDE